MKNLLFASMFIFCLFGTSNAQVSFGVKASVSPTFAPKTNHVFANRATPRDEIAFNIDQVQNAFSVGVYSQVRLNESFFLQGEALLSKYETSYQTINTWNALERSEAPTYYNEKTTRIDLPLSIGVNLGNFEFLSGLVGHFVLSNENEMIAMEGYTESLNKVQLGFQTGFGINISNINLGMTYQMDFQNYGEHMNINGSNLALQNSPARIMASVGFKF